MLPWLPYCRSSVSGGRKSWLWREPQCEWPRPDPHAAAVPTRKQEYKQGFIQRTKDPYS